MFNTKSIRMKKLLLSLMYLIFCSGFMFSQNNTFASGAEIVFKNEMHDFGNIPKGFNATTDFIFTNTGNEPLIITHAAGSCGCTVPEWPKEPIAPGKSSIIKVTYDSQRLGPINKSVTITSNAVNEPNKMIHIRGNVQTNE